MIIDFLKWSMYSISFNYLVQQFKNIRFEVISPPCTCIAQVYLYLPSLANDSFYSLSYLRTWSGGWEDINKKGGAKNILPSSVLFQLEIVLQLSILSLCPSSHPQYNKIAWILGIFACQRNSQVAPSHNWVIDFFLLF